MAEAATSRRMTTAEFLRWEDGSDTRYELVQGCPVAMAPPADRHGTIAANAAVEIDRRLESRPPCRPVLEAGIWIDDENYYVADGAATCAAPCEAVHLSDPFLIVEVLSQANEKEEFATKVQAYIKLPHVQEIWLVDSRKRWVQPWRRAGADSWIVALPLGGDALFESPSLGDRIALDRLYRNTGL